MKKSANIFAELKEIQYKTKISKSLEVFNLNDFLNGKTSSKSNFILKSGEEEYALSQWISPKRTRSFPFARVYDTLCRKNRVTLIPFCKDEGADGDQDFLQWDTVSLMSLLNVYVIICYYIKAEKNKRPGQENKNKISKQILDYDYIGKQIGELKNYHSSALHWNLKQMEKLPDIGKLTLYYYQKISIQTGVLLHGENGIKDRIKTAEKDALKFRDLSRELAKRAQIRETLTSQPKEKVIGQKAVLTLKNLLGGMYYWTVDECLVLDGCVFLVEKKHSKHKLFPSQNDLKDAFLKLALFSNINNLKYNNMDMPYYSAVGLTSKTVCGVLHSEMSDEELREFFLKNRVGNKDKKFILSAIDEAKRNFFGLFIVNEKSSINEQGSILQNLRKRTNSTKFQ